MTSNFYITKQIFSNFGKQTGRYFFQHLNGNLLFLSECRIFNPKTKFTPTNTHRNTNPLLLEQIQPPVSFGVEGSSNRRPRRHISAETRPQTAGLDKIKQPTTGWHFLLYLPLMSTEAQCWQKLTEDMLHFGFNVTPFAKTGDNLRTLSIFTFKQSKFYL